MTKETKSEPVGNKRVYVRLMDSRDERMLTSLKKIIDEYKGQTDVVLVLGADDRKQIIKLPSGMVASEAALERLRETVGTESVVVQ